MLQVSDGSFYPALHKLEQEGWITAEWMATESNRRAKFYSLTRAGRKQLQLEASQWERFVRRHHRRRASPRGLTMSVDRLLRVIVMRCRSLGQAPRRGARPRRRARDHIDRQIAHHIGRGVSADEARRLALRAMGGVELRKEQVRDVRGTRWLEEVAQDVRGGLRLLRRSPGFSAVVVLTLALGIGANAAVFSMVDAVLLHPLAVYRPDELVAISQALTDRIPNGGVSYPLYRDVAERSAR